MDDQIINNLDFGSFGGFSDDGIWVELGNINILTFKFFKFFIYSDLYSIIF